MIAAILISASTFTLFIFLHAILFHFKKIHAKVKTMALIALMVCPLNGLGVYLINGQFLSRINSEWTTQVTALLIFMFLWFGYLQFYFIVERGISPRILMHFLEGKDYSLTIDQLESKYSLSDMANRRIRQMVQVGLLTHENSGNYINSPKGGFFGKVFGRIKEFLQLGQGG